MRFAAVRFAAVRFAAVRFATGFAPPRAVTAQRAVQLPPQAPAELGIPARGQVQTVRRPQPPVRVEAPHHRAHVDHCTPRPEAPRGGVFCAERGFGCGVELGVKVFEPAELAGALALDHGQRHRAHARLVVHAVNLPQIRHCCSNDVRRPVHGSNIIGACHNDCDISRFQLHHGRGLANDVGDFAGRHAHQPQRPRRAPRRCLRWVRRRVCWQFLFSLIRCFI